MLSLLLLTACLDEPWDTGGEPSPCECSTVETFELALTDAGGFDDWSGTALGWAVDAEAGRALVIAARFELPIAQVAIEPDCTAAQDTISSWSPAVPPSLTMAAGRWPLLSTALTDAAGIRSLAVPEAAILLEGDLSSTEPDRIWVATGGNVTLVRGDESYMMQGALVFNAQADAIGGSAEQACGEGLRLTRLDLDFAGTGSD